MNVPVTVETLPLNPELAAGITQLAESGFSMPAVTRGDWQQLRHATENLMTAATSVMPVPDTVRTVDFATTTSDGAVLPMRWYTAEGSGSADGPGAAAVYIHGGGMIMCDATMYHPIYAGFVAASGVPILAVDFRNAPDVDGAALAEDNLRAVQWLREHAADLHVDPARIAVMGESGGGGIAAATAILARDRGVPLAKQILMCPMLDDRTVEPDPFIAPHATWSYDANFTAWTAVLGAARGSADVAPTVAAARLINAGGLAPAYIDTGELDIFRNEDIAYAMKLLDAGVHVDLHLYPGVTHGWEGVIPTSALARLASANRVAALRSF